MIRTVVDLLEGNERHAEEFGSRFENLQDAQAPEAVTVCCSDSRVLQDDMWDNDDPGYVFTVGNIGNRVLQRTEAGDVVSGDVLYPVAHTGTEAVVVVGHTGCGAVTATYDALTDGLSEPPGIEYCVDLLRPQIEPGVELLPHDVDRAEAINRLVEYNVDRQVDALVGSDDVPKSVEVVGAVYDFQDVYSDRRGRVHVINVDGETDPEELRERHAELEPWIGRRWEY